jgi:radical SAM protein with 4Fe4S-binding SPASM domain
MKNERVAKIARYWPLVEGGRANMPISIQVALTDSCFNRCIGCGHPSREQNKMNVESWLGFLESLPHRPESVCYSGGDPMAYSDFNEVMKWHIEHDVLFGCTITGYVPPTISLDLLSRAAWVRVSLDAIDPEVYAAVRGKTPLHKVLDGIDRMIAWGVNVELGVTLHPDNESQRPKILEYADSMHIKEVFMHYAYPQSNPAWPDIDKADRNIQSFNNCKAALYQLYIDSDGSVYPCCITAGDTKSKAQGVTLGNIWQDAWTDIWSNVVYYSEIDISNLPDVCKNCCVQRLSEINNVCGNLTPHKSFF